MNFIVQPIKFQVAASTLFALASENCLCILTNATLEQNRNGVFE